MQPEHVELFIREFTAEWNRLASDASAGIDVKRRELAAVERKLANLIDAIAEGMRAPGLQEKLTELVGSAWGRISRSQRRHCRRCIPISPGFIAPNSTSCAKPSRTQMIPPRSKRHGP